MNFGISILPDLSSNDASLHARAKAPGGVDPPGARSLDLV